MTVPQIIQKYRTEGLITDAPRKVGRPRVLTDEQRKANKKAASTKWSRARSARRALAKAIELEAWDKLTPQQKNRIVMKKRRKGQ